jgi:hypothetical protein
VAGGGERRVDGTCVPAQARGQQLGGRRLTERPRSQGHRRRVPGQFAEHRHVHRPLGRAQGAGDEYGQPVEAPCQVGEEAQRSPVTPVQVVDDDRQRAVDGEVGREPVQAVERGERRVPVAGLDDDVEHLAGRGRRTDQSSLLRGGIHQRRLEELTHHAERERPLQRTAPGGQDAQTCGRAAPPRLGQQPRLADAGRALEQQHARLAVHDPTDRRVNRGDLVLALEQERRRHPTANRGRFPPTCASVTGRPVQR